MGSSRSRGDTTDFGSSKTSRCRACWPPATFRRWEEANFFDERLGCSRPCQLYWRVAEGGVLARAFRLYALMVRPERWHWNGGAFESLASGSDTRSAIYIVRDSDEVAALQWSACESGHLRRFGNAPSRTGVASVADWLRRSGVDLQGFAEHTIRVHTDEVDAAGESAWLAAKAKSDRVLQRIRVARRPGELGVIRGEGAHPQRRI